MNAGQDQVATCSPDDYMQHRTIWQAIDELCDWLEAREMTAGYASLSQDIRQAVSKVHHNYGRGD